MKIFDTISFQSMFLIVAGVALFVLMLLLFSGKKKTYRAAMMLNKSDVELKRKKGGQEAILQTSIIDTFFDKTKILSKYAPYKVITEAREVEWKIGYKEYTGIALAGAVGLSVLFYFYLGKTYMSAYVGLLGIVIPRLVLYYKNMEFQLKRRDRIGIFIKAVTNSMAVFGNAIDAIEEVMPLVHETLRADLTKAVALLKSGKNLTFAFSSMLEKYDYQDLHFFLEMLEVAHEHGGEYNDILSNISEDYDQQKILQFKLARSMALAKKAFYQNAAIVGGLPILFVFVQGGQLYMYLTTGYLDGILGPIAMILNFCVICFFWYKLEKISQFDLDGGN